MCFFQWLSHPNTAKDCVPTGWTPKSGVNILPYATLEAGLTSACEMKLSKRAGHTLPAPTEMQRQGRVSSEHRKVSTAPVCFHAPKPELQGPHS